LVRVEEMSLSKIFRADNRFIPVKILPEAVDDTDTLILTPPPPDPLQPESEEPETIVPIPPDENGESPADDADSGKPVDGVADIEAIRNEAYRLGEEEGKKQALLEFSSAMQAFSSCCNELDRMRSTILEESREEMINLIIAVARRIIGEELSTGRNTIALILEESLQAAIQSREFHVILNPEDLRLAARHKSRLISSIRGLRSLVLTTDPRITPGGLRLESDVCEVDATVETRLAAVEKHLRDHNGKTAAFAEQAGESVSP